MRTHVKRDMLAEQAAKEGAVSEPRKETVLEAAPDLSVIMYKCPDLGPAVLPKAEMEAYIEEFLLRQLADEPEMTSALMVHTLNKDRQKVKMCIETLCKYLDNIVNHPEEEKYRKIRVKNKAFSERVLSLHGTEEVLAAVGFTKSMFPVDENEEEFYYLQEENAKDVDRLNCIKEVLMAAEPLKPQLDRSLKVFSPSPVASRFDIPDEFYAVKKEEYKREQQARTEAVEKLGMLRTKAMKERDEQRELRMYRFTMIRVRFPDGVLLQGTFRTSEKFSALLDFIRENLANDWMPFGIATSTGLKLTEEDLTFAELSLTPAAVVMFSWDQSVLKDIAAEKGSVVTNNYLKPEIKQQIQSL